MKIKSLFFPLFFVLLLGFTSCHQITATAFGLFATDDDTTTVIFPAPLGTVSDFENVLTDEQIRALDSIIIRYEKKSNNKISIVSTRSIKPYTSLHDYSVDLFENWKNQDDRKRSVLISVSTHSGEAQIVTGSNLKRKISDKESKRIVKKIILPEIKKGESFIGIEKGLKKVINQIQ